MNKTMNISMRLKNDAEDVWKKILEHPFVEELCRGTLPMEKFKFYILQDYNYLISSIKNFSVISSRADSPDAMREIIEILHLETISEFEGYEKLLGKLGYTIKDAIDLEPIHENVSYTSFLLSTSSLKSYAESITSVLPCYWSYAEIAEHNMDKLKKNRNKIYADWASAYTSSSYLNLVGKLRKLVDLAGEKFPYDKLNRIFMTACRYEYAFWNAVYDMATWPV
jgi:thiaminase/transcriptional activator TenA